MTTTKKANNLASAIAVSIGLYLFLTSAFFPLDFLSPFDAKRVLQLILFTALLAFAAAWVPLRNKTVSQLARLSTMSLSALGLFFLLGLVSALRLQHPAYALVDVAMLFMMLLLIAVTAAGRDLAGKQFDRWAIVLLAATGCAVTIQEFTGFVVGWVMGIEFNYKLSFVHFSNPRFFNQVQTWSIPVLAALPLIFPAQRRLKLVCVALLGLQWFLVIAAAARGTLISLLGAMVFIAFWLPQQRKFWLKYQLAGVLTGITIYLGILFLNGQLLPASRSGEFYTHSVGRPMTSTSGRSTLWRLSIEDAIRHPLLGTGPTRYACDSELTLPAHPHNFVLRILGEWGLLAAFLLLAILITFAMGFLKCLKQPDAASQTGPPLRAMLATSLIAGALHACLSGLLMMPASQVTMLLVSGWVLGQYTTPRRSQLPSVVVASVLVAGLLSSASTLLFATGELAHLPNRTQYSTQGGPVVPGFWQNGRACKYVYAPVTKKM